MSKPRKMPRQRPRRREQTVGTPTEFIAACNRKFGPIRFDLAATVDNAVSPNFYGPGSEKYAHDAFTACWAALQRLSFLNPPFGKIGPWAKKCAEEAADGARVLLLVPASTGADWFNTYLRPHAFIFELAPRLQFKGHDAGYPKDLILAYFGPEGFVGRAAWRWKK